MFKHQSSGLLLKDDGIYQKTPPTFFLHPIVLVCMSLLSARPLGDVQFISLVIGLKTTEYLFGACATIWLYDYFITLDREMALVWRSPWSFGKIMYFLNRYSPIIDIVLRINSMRAVSNAEECRRFVPVSVWLLVIGFAWSEIILTMRTWAIWGATRHMLIFLITFTMGIIITSCVLTQRINRQVVADVPVLIPVLGVICMPLPNHETMWLLALTYMVSQAVITGLALFRGCQQYHMIRSPLWATMFHDGLLYYVYTFALTITYIFIIVAIPVQWGSLLDLPLRVLTSVFCTRVLLNIKGAHFKFIYPSLTTMSIGFVVGRPGDTHSESHSVARPEAGGEVLGDRSLGEA